MDTDKRWWPKQFDSYFKPRGEKPEPVNSSAWKTSPTVQLTSGLAPYEPALTFEDTQHLLRRAQFGSTVDRAQLHVGKTASDLVDELIDAALSAPLPEPPHWHNAYLPEDGQSEEVFDAYFRNNNQWGNQYATDWFKAIYFDGLRERMALFWHDHFVTERETYFFAPMMYQYATLLRSRALGNFKDFVLAITLNPAMLVYLNGNQNVRQEPNENYARELLELFTMGQYDAQGNANYTQFDIIEFSRALTGYYVDYRDFSTQWGQNRYDGGQKVLFGETGQFNTQKAINHIFETRAEQVAAFICRKLYVEFVHNVPDEAFIQELAQVFINNDFEIAPVMRALLKSERFFDGALRGARIKSPVAMLVNMLHQINFELETPEPYEALYWKSSDLGQRLFQPPNVAGWKGYRNWITTATLPSRWELIEQLLQGDLTGYITSIVPIARALIDTEDPHHVFKLPVAIAQHFMAVPVDNLGFEAPTVDFNGDLVTYPIPEDVMNGPAYVRDLAKIFLAGKPWYEWRLNTPGIIFLLLDYVQFLVELPEYQLT
ncbi:MAG: DUF1800 domain-containing protein [Rhodothermaceae bacterium]|nr:DUF1800 domain-containing protein [Rhodothermaceae bacterium]